MKTEHTPTPWEVRQPTLSGAVPSWREVVSIREKGLPVYIGGAHEWDATFIVRACNNHERLVSALTNINGVAARMAEQSSGAQACFIRDEARAALKELNQ